MFSIHDLRLTQNFTAFNTICKREKIDFFLMFDVVKLLQISVDKGESIFEKQIPFSRVEDKVFLKSIIKRRGDLLLDFGEEVYSVKNKTYFLFQEMYEIQKESDKKVEEFKREYNCSFILV